VFHGLERQPSSRASPRHSTQDPIPLGEDVKSYPRHVAQAVEMLRNAGVGGPFGLALEPRAYTASTEVVELSGLVLDHLAEILRGPGRLGRRVLRGWCRAQPSGAATS